MDKVIERLKNITKHKQLMLTTRGNLAIFFALYLAKKQGRTCVYIPDQGGWLTYREYPKILGMGIKYLETDNGIINPNTIPQSENVVLLYAQPAGYFVEQDMESIYKHCSNKTLVIADVSGSIGSDMCKGEFADILVGSFGEWKPINIGYGGFISTKTKEFFDQGKEIFTLNKVHKDFEFELIEKISYLDERYKMFYENAKKIKKDLAKYEIIHPDKKGINVVVAFGDEKQKKEIISYCVNNKFEYTICPRYIRVNRNAISIEVKRL